MTKQKKGFMLFDTALTEEEVKFIYHQQKFIKLLRYQLGIKKTK